MVMDVAEMDQVSVDGIRGDVVLYMYDNGGMWMLPKRMLPCVEFMDVNMNCFVVILCSLYSCSVIDSWGMSYERLSDNAGEAPSGASHESRYEI
jgi:hypothetical protein